MTKSRGVGYGALAVLTSEQVAEIRALYETPEWTSYAKVGAKYGVGKTVVYNFINKRTYRSLIT